jgi:hypothetical protein
MSVVLTIILCAKASTPPTSFFLLESGSNLLLEDGSSKLGLES